MSKWNDSAWPALVSGAACPICRAGEPFDIVAELEAAHLTASAAAPMRGYACLVAKRHVVELYELAPEEAAAFMRDAALAARAVKTATGAVKLNYEIHGNTIPHLHLHIYPRYPGDPFEGGPIDPKRIADSPYRAGELERFLQALKTALGAAPSQWGRWPPSSRASRAAMRRRAGPSARRNLLSEFMKKGSDPLCKGV